MNRNIVDMLSSSFEHLLQNNANLTSIDLEAEIINIASYIYLKGSSEIDFSLNYINKNNIDSLHNQDFDIVDEIIDTAAILFKNHYGYVEVINAKHGVRINVEVADNYGAFLKAYFTSKHKIDNLNAYQNIVRVVPKAVSDSRMVHDLNSIRNINNNKQLQDYLIQYYAEDSVHPTVIGVAIEKFYSWGEIDKCIYYSSMICNLSPIPTDMEYGNSWWNAIGVYLTYPLINVKLAEDFDGSDLRNAVFCAYTALCIGISISKGEAYDSLNIRSKLMHRYQRLFKTFIQENIDKSFDNGEIYKMIICDKYMAANWYQHEGLSKEFSRTQKSIEPFYDWFVTNESTNVTIHELFIDGDNHHMKYNPDFVQAYNDRKFYISPTDYEALFK